MADFYVDAIGGASGNSGASELLPKQFLSQVTLANGNRVFLKRNQTHPVSTYRFFLSNQTMTPFSTGRKPIVQKSAGSDAWIYIQNATNVLLEHFDIDPNGFNGTCLTLNANSGSAISKVTLRNIECWGSPNQVGIYMQGTVTTGTLRDITVEDCISHGHYNHGFHVVGDAANVVLRRCIGYGNGLGVGAHNFSAWTSNAAYAPTRTRWEFCESYGCVDSDGIEGTGIQSDDSTTGSVLLGCYSHGNAGGGVTLNAASGGHTVMGCLIVGNGKPGVYATGVSSAHKILSNTITGNVTRGGSWQAEVWVTNGSSVNHVVSNNILLNTTAVPKGIAYAGTGGHTGVTNCIFGYATPSENITLTGTKSTNPALTSDYRLPSTSPCKGAGTYIPRARHFGGASMSPAAPDIGAMRYSAGRSARASPQTAARGSASYSVSRLRAPT